jgi:hypothetical protein
MKATKPMKARVSVMVCSMAVRQFPKCARRAGCRWG